MINSVVAVPVMVMIMPVSTSKAVMGEFTLSRGLRVLGWLATAVMGVAAGGMFATLSQA